MTTTNPPAAFPTPSQTEQRPAGKMGPSGAVIDYKIDAQDGMNLRDYFAAKALAGLLASPHNEIRDASQIASLSDLSYDFANAMLSAREKRGAE